MKYNYNIDQNLYNDAWNWWNACNTSSHGFDWKTKTDPEVLKHIYGKSKKEAYKFLIPFLEKKYQAEKEQIESSKQLIKTELETKFNDGCNRMVKLMGKPLYRNNYIFSLTTFGRAPYKKEEGLIFLPIYYKDPMRTILHELCHFQFIHYWRENPDSEVSKLLKNEFEFLKESLTIILDESVIPLINEPDRGYAIHKVFREKLSTYWKEYKDFDKLVRFGTKKVKNYT